MAIPTSATVIDFFKGVPLFPDLKDTRWFTNTSSQNNYFNGRSKVHTMTQANFQRIEGFNYVAVDKHIDDLWHVNYLRFRNSGYGNKWFYAFVIKMEYKNANTTHLYFKVDTLQTWQFELNFKPSYVVREHCRLWESDGTPVLNTVDENLDYGTEYDTVKVEKFKKNSDLMYLVVGMTTNVGSESGDPSDEGKIIPTYTGIPQPISYYFIPFKLGSYEPTGGTSPTIKVAYNGNNISGVNFPVDPLTVIKGLSESEDTVNNVVTSYVTDDMGVKVEFSNNTVNFISHKPVAVSFSDDKANNFVMYKLDKGATQFSNTVKDFGNKYSGFKNVDESKLLMYPYTVITLDDRKGNRQDYKVEYIRDKNLKIKSYGSIGSANKVAYGIEHYLADNNMDNLGQQETTYEHALINQNAQDIPVVNDMLSAYMQGNRNSLQAQKNQIVWNTLLATLGQGVNAGSFGMSSAYAGRHGSDVWQTFGAVSGGLGATAMTLNMLQGAGNGLLELEKINAKIQDIKNQPASLVNQGSNTNFDMGYGFNGVSIIKKQITAEYRKKLSDFFKKYGYKVNELKIPNLTTRQNWNFVQTTDINIHANINNEDLAEIKNAFDNGITLWHTNDIGNYNLANGVK